MASSSKKSAAIVNLLGKRKPEDDSGTKPFLRKHKENSEEKEQIKRRVELLETKSDQANLISVKETVERLEDETPDFVEEAAVPKKTLFVDHLHPRTNISDIIDFFQDVGQVVRVRLVVNRKAKHLAKHLGYGFVEFASANEAKRALQEKNGEYLHNREILLYDVADKGATYLTPEYCIDHTVWNEDYLQRESLSILPIKEDETPPAFVEDVLIVANLSPQTKRLEHIIGFFKDVGTVVSVRLAVDCKGKHVGYGFVEFASANDTKRALEEKNGQYLHDHRILLMKGLDETPDPVEAAAIRNKTLFVANFSPQTTKISDMIDFFKDVGEVVHVRLIVNNSRHDGYGFVEFASSNKAKKALEKNSECLNDRKIILRVVERPYPPPKYCIDHNVWYEDYLRQESLLIEEDAAVRGLDETPDFVEEVALIKKTLFVANIPANSGIPPLISFFKSVGDVVRVRLIVDHWGEHVGCGFVELASANEAKRALREKNGGRIFLDVPEIAPYPFRPKYKLAEKLWYEDNLRRFSLYYDLETKPDLKLCYEDNLRLFSLDLETKPDLKKAEVEFLWCGKKTVFSDDD